MSGLDITAVMRGDKELVVRLKEMPHVVHAALQVKIVYLALMLENYIKTEKLDGQVLNRISGALARSIHYQVEDSESEITARIFSSGDVKYAGIHEYGGTIPPHVQMSGGKNPKEFNHPGARMPERSFLRSSLRDKSAEISLSLKETAVRAAMGEEK